jgi:class 3 adenylate cyclase
MGDVPADMTLTYLFSDVEGSTRLWERHPEAMQDALARHDAILRAAVEGCGGTVVKTTGDGLMAVFGSALDAITASLAAQEGLRDEPWGETGPLRVRMGTHVGEAQTRAGDYYGAAVNRAARVMAAAHGGQVLLSAPIAELVAGSLPDDVHLRDLGTHRLKDLAGPEHLFQLVRPGLPDTFAPLATLDVRPNNLPT